MTEPSDTPREPSALHGLASIAQGGHPWYETIRVAADLAERLAADRALPDPTVTDQLLDAQLEQFAEDVARGIIGPPQERHAIILARKGRDHVLMEAVWRHVDRLRNEEG